MIRVIFRIVFIVFVFLTFMVGFCSIVFRFGVFRFFPPFTIIVLVMGSV